ncbi:MAG: hypothetical protein OEY52_02350 [Gammaproteobacteria bacterium]|nr:hypothetical protein [Gammaproteobacteria bacterium]
MRQGLLQIGFLVLTMGWLNIASAQDHSREDLGPVFKLQKNENLLKPDLASTLKPDSSAGKIHRSNGSESQLRTYDAILYYPLHRQGVSFDLGVNLRLQEDANQAYLPLSQNQDWLNIDPTETRTRVHAAAIFELPFSGLKAGVSGTYDPNLDSQEYDYKAKLFYQWRNGFGLQGGWQHQQNPLELQNQNESQDVQTLFLDLNYRF